MTDFETGNGSTRDDLLQRVALMETMIAEGRRTTTRFGWVFVLWGLVDMAGLAWQYLQQQSYWVWPITLSIGFLLQVAGIFYCMSTTRACRQTTQSRSIQAVWSMMGLAMMFYVGSALIRHLTWQISYTAGIFMLVGLAHAISAVLLRWRAQGLVAALWWIGGVATFFVPGEYRLAVFAGEMFLGFFCFGVYAMTLERRDRATRVQQHA